LGKTLLVCPQREGNLLVSNCFPRQLFLVTTLLGGVSLSATSSGTEQDLCRSEICRLNVVQAVWFEKLVKTMSRQIGSAPLDLINDAAAAVVAAVVKDGGIKHMEEVWQAHCRPTLRPQLWRCSVPKGPTHKQINRERGCAQRVGTQSFGVTRLEAHSGPVAVRRRKLLPLQHHLQLPLLLSLPFQCQPNPLAPSSPVEPPAPPPFEGPTGGGMEVCL
jgi:hypothetical protein